MSDEEKKEEEGTSTENTEEKTPEEPAAEASGTEEPTPPEQGATEASAGEAPAEGQATQPPVSDNAAMVNEKVAVAKEVLMGLVDDVKAGKLPVILGLAAILLGLLSCLGMSGSPIYNTLLLLSPGLVGYVIATGLQQKEEDGKKVLILGAIAAVLCLYASYCYGDGLAGLAQLRKLMK